MTDHFDPNPQATIRALARRPLIIALDKSLSRDLTAQVAQFEILLWLNFIETVAYPIEHACIQEGRTRYIENACRIMAIIDENERWIIIEDVMRCTILAGNHAQFYSAANRRIPYITLPDYIKACDQVRIEQEELASSTDRKPELELCKDVPPHSEQLS